jgi:thiamine transporter ThiT
MSKSGLIVGVFSLFMVLGVSTVITPYCAPCLTVFLGLAAGYFAGVFDKPPSKDEITKQGANSGLIAGGLSFIGQVIASIINGTVVGPEGANAFSDALGLPTSVTAESYYISLVAITICVGVLNLGIMAGFGALGGIAWWQFSGKDSAPQGEVVQPDL